MRDVAQLIEYRASNQKVAKPWFDSRCGNASLGGPAWRKVCKQNSFCVGVVRQTQSLQHLVQT